MLNIFGMVINEEDPTKYCSGVGKMLHMISWRRLDIRNSVQDCASYMQEPTKEQKTLC